MDVELIAEESTGSSRASETVAEVHSDGTANGSLYASGMLMHLWCSTVRDTVLLAMTVPNNALHILPRNDGQLCCSRVVVMSSSARSSMRDRVDFCRHIS